MQYRLICLIALGIAVLTACSPSEKECAATVVHNVFVTYPVSNGGSTVTTLPAMVEEGRTISVGFKTGGQIERILVKEGARISKGQLVAVLDSSDYALGVATLREKYSSLKSETERQTKLHASRNMSDNDYEKAVSGLRQLALQLNIEENRLGYCRLYAPANGVVTKVNFENSEMVDAGTPVIELMDNSSLEAIVDLPVRLYAQREYFTDFVGESSLAPGKMVKLNMLSLTPRADNTQLYRLRLGVPPTSWLTPGMNLKVRICSRNDANHSVDVPLSSVFERDGRRYVWIVNEADSVVRASEIVTAGTGENGVVSVVSGVNADDIIVRAGVRHLVDGEKVKIISEGSLTNPGNIL